MPTIFEPLSKKTLSLTTIGSILRLINPTRSICLFFYVGKMSLRFKTSSCAYLHHVACQESFPLTAANNRRRTEAPSINTHKSISAVYHQVC